MRAWIAGLVAMAAVAGAQGFERFYEAVPVVVPQAYGGHDYVLPLDLGTVENLALFDLGDPERTLLEANGFVVVPAAWGEFYQLYERNSYPVAVPDDEERDAYLGYAPMFITTDAVLHAYHLVFDKILRELERRELAPRLAHLTDALTVAAERRWTQMRGTELEDAAGVTLAYLGVARALLGSTAPAPPQAVRNVVEAELDLIDAHEAVALSPLLTSSTGCADPYRENCTQYRPRGHYTASAELERYFRAMTWYGRVTLRSCSALETRAALLLTDLLRTTPVDGVPAEQAWASLYDVTSFFAGTSDDLGLREYAALADSIFPDATGWASLYDGERVAALQEAVRALPPPRIDALVVGAGTSAAAAEERARSTQGFRFLGQRFTLDGYILSQLTYPRVGTPALPRALPRALDVPAALGSAEALALLVDAGETRYAHYLERLGATRSELAALDLRAWTASLAGGWLRALRALLSEHGTAFPSFMRTDAWQRKDLQTALASLTELKHDTVLYAKQMMAERGAGPFDLPGGYVEPDPEAFARMLALVRMTRGGLEDAGLVPACRARAGACENLSAANLADLESMLTFLVSAAERELAGATLDADDYARILYFGGWLEDMTLRSSDNAEDPDVAPGTLAGDEQSALVTDVATSTYGDVLHQATGRVSEIYVAVPAVTLRVGPGPEPGQDRYELVRGDGIQLAKGGVFSVYEFVMPPDRRLTDDDWQAALESGGAPPMAGWTELFTAP